MIRDNIFLFTEDLAVFSDSQMIWEESWVDSIEGNDLLLMKNVSAKDLFDFERLLFRSIYYGLLENPVGMIAIPRINYDIRLERKIPRWPLSQMQ